MAVTHSPASVEVAVQHRWGLVTVGSTFFPAAPEADDNLITLYRTRMLTSGVASEDLTIIAARNTYVAAGEGEAHAFMQPRLQWAGDLARYLRSPVSTLARTGGLQGYEAYARDPFIDPELVQRRGQEALGAIGTPAQVTATIKDLQARHVTHFLCYMDSNNSPLSLVVTMTLFGNMASRVQGDVYFTGVHEIIALTNLPLFITCKDLLS